MPEQLPPATAAAATTARATAPGANGEIAPDLMTEYLTDGWGYFIRSSKVLERFRSRFQNVEVHDSPAFGRLFRLDGHFMTSERDEFFYHENLVHMAALSHVNPARALVIGGGDGGSAEELLKYASMCSVTLCEIDEAVVDISRRYLGAVHRGAFDDPRLHVYIGDGLKFVRDDRSQYDLIVLDLTDPGGPSTPLYTAEFYRACTLRLADGGALTLHVASPIAHPDRIRESIADLHTAFARVTPYLTSIPLYGGMWMMACASQSLDPAALSESEIDERIAVRAIGDLSCYNGAMHRAALALPNFVRTLVASPALGAKA
ncbi:MAG: polyamine aminopropyltransferase [Pseudomonadota bacterium]|nr:polyamine aminopropyltransferase [Pseudomonadota bacterium]